MHNNTIKCMMGRLHGFIPTFCLIFNDDGVAGRWNNVSWDVNPESCDETLCNRIVPMGICYQRKQDKFMPKN